MHIRRAVPADLPAINRLTVQMHKELASLLETKLAPAALEEEKMTEKELARVLVADAGRVAGYASVSRPRKGEWYGRYLELEHLVVDKQFRQQGVGSQLLQAVVKEAKGLSVLVETPVNNTGALAFYKKAGFRPMELKLVLGHQKRLK